MYGEDIEFVNGLGATESDEEFLGKIRRNTKKARTAMRNTAKAAKAKAGRKSTKVSVNVPATAASASGKEMAAMASMLTPELQEGLKKGSIRMADATIYVVKPINAVKNVRMFEDSDDKLIGVCNISKAKLEKNEVMCLSAIQVLYGVSQLSTPAATLSQENVATIDWGEIPTAVQSGEFTFRAGGNTKLDRVSMQVFKNHKVDAVNDTTNHYASATSYGQGEMGFYKLANPQLIKTQEAIDMFVEWAANAPANSFLKVILYGTKLMSR